MLTLSFPKIHKALNKSVSKLEPDDPQRGVIIVGEVAIVYRGDFTLCVDLREYFTVEHEIVEQEDQDALTQILFFMDNQVYDFEFWNELTKGANMSISQGRLHISTPRHDKYLSNKPSSIAYYTVLEGLMGGVKDEANVIDKIALPFVSLKMVYDTYASEFKNDSIILEFSSQDRPVRFTFKNRTHFYGFIYPNYTASVEAFVFDLYERFVRSIPFHDALSDNKKQFQRSLPPPPPGSKPDVDEAQTEMF